MSGTDRAFIKAYGRSAAAAPPPAPEPGVADEALHTIHRHRHAAAEAVPPPPHIAPLGTGRAGCQPLSAFTRTAADDAGFKPALRVDKFQWPNVCEALSRQLRRHWDGVATRLSAAARSGHRVVAVGACRGGEGCTTTLLCLARHLARPDRPVVMVDADFRQPDLALRLGLTVPAGWEDVLRAQEPLTQAMVASGQDHLSLLPLRAASADAHTLAGGVPLSTSLRLLRQHFQMVLVDLGPLLDAPAAGPALTLAQQCGVDAALLVRDARRTRDDELQAVTGALVQIGVPAIGMAETFATNRAA